MGSAVDLPIEDQLAELKHCMDQFRPQIESNAWLQYVIESLWISRFFLRSSTFSTHYLLGLLDFVIWNALSRIHLIFIWNANEIAT